MKHCSSLWRDERIRGVSLNKLSPMGWHSDNRWYWRDLPRIIDHGLWYPMIYFKITPEWWNTSYFKRKGSHPMWEHINPPVINDDGMIWGIYIGTNRYRCLKFMGDKSVDCIECKNQSEAIELGSYLKEKGQFYNDKL